MAWLLRSVFWPGPTGGHLSEVSSTCVVSVGTSREASSMSRDSVRSSKSPSWLFPYICILLHLKLRRLFQRFWEATVLVCHIFLRQRETPQRSRNPFSGDAKCREGMTAVRRILDLFLGEVSFFLFFWLFCI